MLLLFGCQSNDEARDTSAEADEETTNTEQEVKQEEVEGTLWGNEGDLGIVLSHGAVYDADSWKEQGEQLADEGMVAFAVENTDSDELVAAAKMLQEDHDVEQVAIVGASAGGESAIEAVNKSNNPFDRVILLSPAGDASEIKETPTLVIYSEDEGFDNLEEEKSDNIKTVVMPGCAHAQELFDDEEESAEVMQQIIDFLAK